MYDCETISKLLHPHLDRELDVKESLRVQAHLQECSYCRDAYLAEKEFLDLLRPHIAPEPRPDFLPTLLPVLSRAARRREQYRHALSPVLFALCGALATVITLVLFKWVSVSPTKGIQEVAQHGASYLQRNVRWLEVASTETPISSIWIANRLSCALDTPAEKVQHQTLLRPDLLREERPQTASH